MMTRTLCFGALPADATPASCVVAGTWCLCNRPELMDDVLPFLLPPEPFEHAKELEHAAQQATNLVVELTPIFGQKINQHVGADLPDSFWEIMLAPWLCRAAEVVVDRLWRLESLKTFYTAEPLDVPLLPYSPCPQFADSKAFLLRGVLSPAWNHWLFSQLLHLAQNPIPETWTLHKAHTPAPDSCVAPPPKAPSLTQACTTSVCQSMRRMVFGLPFPRMKGLSIVESLRLSAALCLNRNTLDKTLPLCTLHQPAPSLPMPHADLANLLWDMLPHSLTKPKLLTLKTASPPRPRTRVMSVAAFDDDELRFDLAAHRARGGRLISVQHGGEYGTARSSVAYAIAEYRQHAFISWGWTQHGSLPGNVTPLPAPQLASLCNKHHEREATLVFVGTEMLLAPYTLKSTRRAGQMFAYRADKARFLEALPQNLHNAVRYRPYFEQPCALPDAEWVLSRFPHVQRCVGPLDPHLLGCRLLVLDHLGTSLLQALAANIPFILFRNPEHQPVTDATAPLLNAFRTANMLFEDPVQAATHCAAVWDHVLDWWHTPTTQAAKRLFAEHHARLARPNENLMNMWTHLLRNI